MAEFHEMNFEGLSQYSVKLSVQISSKPDYLTRLKNAMFLLSKYTFLFYPFFYFFYDLAVYHKTSKDRYATVHIFSAFSNYCKICILKMLKIGLLFTIKYNDFFKYKSNVSNISVKVGRQ